MNAKRALLASFSVAACITAQPLFAGDASETWADYRKANNLPIYATPSVPAVSNDRLFAEMSRSDGDAHPFGAAIQVARANGNGNGNGSANGNGGHSSADDPARAELLREMARTD